MIQYEHTAGLRTTCIYFQYKYAIQQLHSVHSRPPILLGGGLTVLQNVQKAGGLIGPQIWRG